MELHPDFLAHHAADTCTPLARSGRTLDLIGDERAYWLRPPHVARDPQRRLAS
jgi:hypothetical protein